MEAHAAPAWASYLPLVILAGVMLWRFRSLNRARPLRPRRMLLVPLVYSALVAALLVTLPPDRVGWIWFAGGLVAGAAVGWQRARLMRLHLDPDSGAVMMRQSPAALILLVCIAALRRVFVPSGGGVDAGGGEALPAAALHLTDGLIGFALGMIVAQRIELWRRARALAAAGPERGI